MEPLSVGELVHSGPLAGAPLVTGVGLDRPVLQVRLVESVEETRDGPPHSAVVLHGSAGGSGWTVESALLAAWERAAACVVAPVAHLRTRSVETLSRRLGVALVGVEGDTAAHALAIAAAVASPEAARASIVARCALKLAEAGTVPRSLVGTLNRELAGVQVALRDADGTVVAGQAGAADPRRDPGHRVTVHVPGPAGESLATLVAVLSRWSPAWADTIRSILRIAVPPLASALVLRRSAVEHDAAHARQALAGLLAASPEDPPAAPPAGQDPPDRTAPEHPPEELQDRSPAAARRQATLDAALALGWRLSGRQVAALLVPVPPRPPEELDRLTPGILGAWRRAGARRPLVRHGEGWATWWTGPAGGGQAPTSARVGAGLHKLIAGLYPGLPLAVGVGEPGTDLAGLRASLDQAAVAAAAARTAASVTGGRQAPIFRYGELGPRGLLAGLPVADLATAARTVLAGVLAAGDGMTLVETMVAVLDAGGSSGRAAARLGVHRNTVIGRLDRLRRLGVDLDDPAAKLPLHLAGHALVHGEPTT